MGRFCFALQEVVLCENETSTVAELGHFQWGSQGETRDHFGVAHKSKYDIRHIEFREYLRHVHAVTLHPNINSDSGVIVKYTFT